MFRHEFVPHTMPDPAGIPPHVREMVGPQFNTVGIIAKQPGSNWLHRKQLAEKRHVEAQRMKVLAATKGFIGAVRRAQFDQRTDKRNLLVRLEKKVKDSLQAADEELECRRNKLREFLLREESEYTEEYVMKAQKVKDEMIETVKKRNLDIRLKREADERRVVEEKRLQQYRLRCEELRIKLSEFYRYELKDAHLKQMEDKLSMQEAEKERDNLYNKLKQKDIEAMKEYEDRLERERQKRVKDIAEVYKKQLEGKQLLLEEDKRLKVEEAKLIEQLRQNIELEKKQEKEEEKRKRWQLQNEMTEQLRREKEILEKKKKDERELELAFCKLIQDELEREKAKQTDTRKQMRREQELYLAYLQEVERQRKEEERKTDELRQNDMKEILRKKEEVEILACKAKENLKNDVLKSRKIQIEERKKRAEAENEMKKLEESEDLKMFERYKQEDEMLKKEQEKKKKMYGEELKRQEELLRIKREKEIEGEEIRVRNELMAEEQYLRKVDLSMDILCDKKHPKHPFRKRLEGAAQ